MFGSLKRFVGYYTGTSLRAQDHFAGFTQRLETVAYHWPQVYDSGDTRTKLRLEANVRYAAWLIQEDYVRWIKLREYIPQDVYTSNERLVELLGDAQAALHKIDSGWGGFKDVVSRCAPPPKPVLSLPRRALLSKPF